MALLLPCLLFLLLSSSTSSQGQATCSALDGVDMCSYQSHRGLLARLRNLERRFPGLAQVETLGQSVEGRELAYVKLSTNVR